MLNKNEFGLTACDEETCAELGKDLIPAKRAKRISEKILITKGNLNDAIKDIFEVSVRKINAIEVKLDKAIRSLKGKSLMFDRMKTTMEVRLKEYAVKMDSVEDTFFTLYHNIKKNQFLYADDPEVWWSDYLDLKKHYKKEIKEK